MFGLFQLDNPPIVFEVSCDNKKICVVIQEQYGCITHHINYHFLDLVYQQTYTRTHLPATQFGRHANT